jgi:nicotinamide-nucleotide amidase
MRIDLVIIGNELLNGDLADTNTRRLGGRLRELGLRVHAAQTVPDDRLAITGAFALAASRADIVLVSGGMGPTSDDLTLEAAASFAGVPLVLHGQTLDSLKARFAARGVPFTENNARQAMVPQGAEVFENATGTAPHVQLQVQGTRFFFFPGVPRELEHLVETWLVPWFEARGIGAAYASRRFKTFGRTESQIATLLAGVEAEVDPDLHVAYRAHFPEIHVSLHAFHPDADRREMALEARAALAAAALGDLVFTTAPGDTLAEVVGRALLSRGETVAVAESCTGGLLGGAITAVSGSSAWFREGFITYSNDAKSKLLGVAEELLLAHGAVSEPVALAMAEGARARSGADWALAVTGIAGPTGGTPDKPVGTVFIALAGPEGARAVHRRFPFDRERNRVVSVHTALDILRKALI